MSNIDSDFRAKAAASTGIYNPDGSRFGRWGMESRASINAPHDPWGGMTRKLSPSEAAAFNATDDGKEVARQVREMRFKNVTVGGTQTPPPEGMFQRVGPNPNAGIGAQPSMAQRAGRMVGETLGKNGGGGLSGALGAATVGVQGLIMDHDGMRSQFYDDPKVSGFDKLRQGARDVKTLALPAAAGIVGGSAGALAGPVGAAAGGVGGAVLGGATDNYIDSVLGTSALDAYKERYARAGKVGLYKPKDLDIIGPGDPRYQQLMDTPNGGIVGQDELPSAKVTRTTFQSNPFARQAAPEVELARQAGNFNQFEAPINAALADRVKASGGVSSFRDAAAQALFNAKQGLNGSGISVSDVNGTPTFTGDNRAGGGQLYRAADGSVTNDWSKTQQYADAIQRNAKDQDRLAELTRGAALSGDKEAVARLTHGDQRLAGIAAEAATEKSLRDAVKGGSRNAAMVLADMEKSKATQGMAQAELGLKRAALVGAQEDRDLNRQLRQDSLSAKVAENQRAAAKDTRETAQARMTTLDKQLEQYATVDGKLDGQKVARLRGLAANLQPSPGQSPEEFNKDVTTHVGLASKLDGMQAFYDRWFSQAGQGGTDLRQWKPNDSIRGGFVTDQGDHISTGQYNSLTDDEKAVFKKLYLKGGK